MGDPGRGADLGRLGARSEDERAAGWTTPLDMDTFERRLNGDVRAADNIARSHGCGAGVPASAARAHTTARRAAIQRQTMERVRAPRTFPTEEEGGSALQQPKKLSSKARAEGVHRALEATTGIEPV
jgi:hypothetical protein